MTPLSTGEVLDRAADRVAAGWTQGAFARTADGELTGWRMDNAVCFCVSGAISRESQGTWGAWNAFDAYTRQRGFRHMAEFNDAPGQTKARVVRALRTVANMHRTASSVGMEAEGRNAPNPDPLRAAANTARAGGEG